MCVVCVCGYYSNDIIIINESNINNINISNNVILLIVIIIILIY